MRHKTNQICFRCAQVLKPGRGWAAGFNLHGVGFYETEKNSENFYFLKASAGSDYGLVRQECGKNLVLPQVLGGIHNVHGIDQLGMYEK